MDEAMEVTREIERKAAAKKPAAKKPAAKKPAAKKPAAKKTAAKKASSKKTTAKKKTAKKKTTSGKSSMQVTATERRLVELYREADSATKKSALAVLRGKETTTSDAIGEIFESAVSTFFGKK